VSTFAVLLGPWLFGVWDTAADAARRRVHGGGARLVLSAVLGVLLGALIAPIMMIHHTRIVASILMGRAVAWIAQRRRAEANLLDVLRAELPATVLGAVGATFAYLEGGPWLWLAPVWVPWLLAVPIHWAVSSAGLGQLARRAGLLLISSETEPEPLLRRIDELRVLTRGDTSARFRDLVLDPVLLAAHVGNLAEEPAPASRNRLELLRTKALQEGPLSLTPADWRLLAADHESMAQLHREAWRHWPVESWDVGGEAPLLPPETPDAPPSTQGSLTAMRSDRDARGRRRPRGKRLPLGAFATGEGARKGDACSMRRWHWSQKPPGDTSVRALLSGGENAVHRLPLFRTSVPGSGRISRPDADRRLRLRLVLAERARAGAPAFRAPLPQHFAGLDGAGATALLPAR
jgi:hypothetical protein